MNFSMKYQKAIFFSLGLLWGIAITFFCGVLFLRTSLIRKEVSPLSYADAVARFQSNVAQVPGWTLRSQKCGLPAMEISVFEICSRKYASELLTSNPELASMIPCRFAFYEENGKTYMATLNHSVFMRLIGGLPASLFSERILPEQKVMLRGILSK